MKCCAQIIAVCRKKTWHKQSVVLVVLITCSCLLKHAYFDRQIGSVKQQQQSGLVILLTATILASEAHVVNTHDGVRMRQYQESVRFWCSTAYPILLVENSNSLREALQLKNICSDKTELIFTEVSKTASTINYGALESAAIREALIKTRYHQSSTYFVKVTGRIIIPNFNDIIDRLECKIYESGCPIAYINPFLLPSPHVPKPYIDTTFMIYTKSAYLDIFSHNDAIPKAVGVPIERTLADHILQACSAGFDLIELRAQCGLSQLGCIRRRGQVGWSGLDYADDADCEFENSTKTFAGNIPPVTFMNYSLLSDQPYASNVVAILTLFEAGPGVGVNGLIAFVRSLDQHADLFVFSRQSKASASVLGVLTNTSQRYILFHPNHRLVAPMRYELDWDELMIGGTKKQYFLRFVVFEFAIRNFIHPSFTHFLISDSNDVLFQNPALFSMPDFLRRRDFISAIEFSKLLGNGSSSMINRMWLAGCVTVTSPLFNSPDTIKYFSSISGGTETVELLRNFHLNVTSTCPGTGEWSECDASGFSHFSNFISCAGTTLASRNIALAYLRHFSVLHSMNMFCNDQGLHNIIVQSYAEQFQTVQDLVPFGVLLTLDSADLDLLTTNGSVVQPHHHAAAFLLVHQYNRCNRQHAVCQVLQDKVNELIKDEPATAQEQKSLELDTN